jgi:hypothetical protein
MAIIQRTTMIKPEYQALRDELLEKELSYYIQPRETISIPYLLKGKCYAWTHKFVEAFPQLRQVCGFYGHGEHYWCVEPDGTIVDPTVEQFDEALDQIYLGKCMNCGSEIYGLKAEGRQEICPPEEGEEESDCSRSLTAYYNSELSRYRHG